MFVRENPDRRKNNQAMCNYLQSEQCHSVDLVNLLTTSREMFPPFTKYLYCGNLKMHSQLRKLCNQPYFFVVDKSEWLFVVENCPTQKLHLGMVTNSTMK